MITGGLSNESRVASARCALPLRCSAKSWARPAGFSSAVLQDEEPPGLGEAVVRRPDGRIKHAGQRIPGHRLVFEVPRHAPKIEDVINAEVGLRYGAIVEPQFFIFPGLAGRIGTLSLSLCNVSGKLSWPVLVREAQPVRLPYHDRRGSQSALVITRRAYPFTKGKLTQADLLPGVPYHQAGDVRPLQVCPG